MTGPAATVSADTVQTRQPAHARTAVIEDLSDIRPCDHKSRAVPIGADRRGDCRASGVQPAACSGQPAISEGYARAPSISIFHSGRDSAPACEARAVGIFEAPRDTSRPARAHTKPPGKIHGFAARPGSRPNDPRKSIVCTAQSGFQNFPRKTIAKMEA